MEGGRPGGEVRREGGGATGDRQLLTAVCTLLLHNSQVLRLALAPWRGSRGPGDGNGRGGGAGLLTAASSSLVRGLVDLDGALGLLAAGCAGLVCL